MLAEIARVTGYPYNEDTPNPILTIVLNRIARKLPENPTVADILEAEKAVNAEGQFAIANLVAQLTAEPPAREYKIKRSLKGARIDTPAPDGTRYSFGPVWNESVKAGKGICLAETARKKLEHQARLLGFAAPEGVDPRLLAKFVALSFDNDKFDPTKALAEATKFAQKAPVATGKATKVGKVAIQQEGPRGFRFGPVWMKAIRECSGIAIKPANAPKLFGTAAHFGITPNPDETLRELCARIAAVLPN